MPLFLKSQKKPEIKAKKNKKPKASINQVNSSINNTNTSFELSDWYFGNPTAVALGQTEFTRIWGSFPLADNWRRSTRAFTAASKTQFDQPVAEVNQPVADKNVPVANPVQVEFDRIIKELPLTDSAIVQAHRKIETAYFTLGDIYYFDLKEAENAIKSYESLLTRYPETRYRAETLYKLYLIFKDLNPAKAEQFADELKKNSLTLRMLRFLLILIISRSQDWL